MQHRRTGIRGRKSERGATLPEYVLMVAAFAVASLGALTVMNDKSDDYMGHQADCIGKIPGSSIAGLECEWQTTTTTTTTTIVGTTAPTPTTSSTTTTIATTTTSLATTSTTTTVPPTSGPTTTIATTTTSANRIAVTVTGTSAADEDESGCPRRSGPWWCGSVSVFVATTPGGTSVGNAVVTLNWSDERGNSGTTSCTTRANNPGRGRCTTNWVQVPDGPSGNDNSIRFTVAGASAAGYTWNGVTASGTANEP